MSDKPEKKDKKEKDRYRSTFYFEGKQYETASSKSQKEADQKAAIKLDKLKRGEVGISGNMTVKRWAEEWLETYKKPALGDKQYNDYKRQVDKDIVPAIGSLSLTDVKDIHLQKIMNSKAGMSETRIKMLHLTICGIFKQARISKLIIHDPSEYLTFPNFTKGTHRSITDFERKHFLKVAETHRAGLMFKVMLYCGLRTGEVVALDWRDIDFQKRRIKVSRAMKSGTTILGDPKTEAGFREIPIPDEIYYDLLAEKGDPFSPVFTRPKNKGRHNESSRDAAWRSFKNQMDISMGAVYEKRKAADKKMRLKKIMSVVAKDFVPYCLRHTYCTDLQKKGVPINVAKYLMGHENISVTAGIYTHMTDDVIDDTAKLIDGKKNGQEKDKQEMCG